MFYEVKLKVINMSLDDEGHQKLGKAVIETYLVEDVGFDGAGFRCLEKFDEKRGGAVISVKETKVLDIYKD